LIAPIELSEALPIALQALLYDLGVGELVIGLILSEYTSTEHGQ
jgi:hypothetical protein